MKYYVLTIMLAASMCACDGANNTNLNPNKVINTSRNVNVSQPETSPYSTPAGSVPGNDNAVRNTAPPAVMTNEKVTTPELQDKRSTNRSVPELKGTPLKKP
jgi:hypothetical protein